MLINNADQIQKQTSHTEWGNTIKYDSIWFYISYNSDFDDMVILDVCTPNLDQQKHLNNFNGNPDKCIHVDHYRFRFDSLAIEQIEFIVLSLLSTKLKQSSPILMTSMYKEFVHFVLGDCLGDIVITDLKAEINDKKIPVLIGVGLDYHSENDSDDSDKKKIKHQFTLDLNVSHLTQLIHLLDCLYTLNKYQDECNELD